MPQSLPVQPWTVVYAPYTAQDNAEIPAFEIFGDDKICDVNEHLPVPVQQAYADLIAAAPAMLDLLKRLNTAFYVSGTSKVLRTVMAETKPLIRTAEGRRST